MPWPHWLVTTEIVGCNLARGKCAQQISYLIRIASFSVEGRWFNPGYPASICQLKITVTVDSQSQWHSSDPRAEKLPRDCEKKTLQLLSLKIHQ